MAEITTDEVLRDEANAIHGAGAVPPNAQGNALYVGLNALQSAALCLSGGGIRSAAFSLGVIQALAMHPRQPNGDRATRAEDSLLSRFHYLSTVSGGGYIGGWLSAWLAHAYQRGRGDWGAVWEPVAGARAAPDREPSQLSWLRTYSNYLTPRLGLASGDSWATVALSLRNLILNWLVIVPVFCAVLIGLKLVASAVAWFSQFDPRDCDASFGRVLVAVGVVTGLSVVASLRFTTRNRPTRGASRATNKAFLLGGLAPACAGAVLFTFLAATPCGETFARNTLGLREGGPPTGKSFGVLAAAGAAVFALAWIAARPRPRPRGDRGRDVLAWAVSGAVYGALAAFGLYLYFGLLPNEGVNLFALQAGADELSRVPWGYEPQAPVPKETLLLTLSLPFLLVAQLLAEMIFVGLTSYQDGSDADREWLARAAGWYLIGVILWSLTMFGVFIGSSLVESVYGQVKTWLIGGGASIVTAWLGKSALSPATGKAQDAKGISTNVVLAIAAPVFAAALVIALSALIDRMLFGKSFIQMADFHRTVTQANYPPWPGGWKLWLALAVVIAVGAIASWCVNINRFSLHSLYRNRIVRAFLGASNPDRHPNAFTGFDETDNLPVHRLWPEPPQGGAWAQVEARSWRPFHLINIALNVVSTEKLAWQERKAEPFTVTPLHSGSSVLGYRPSRDYGGGITLGTAVAISGAAASPNMGYHSSPTLAFLLTLFNVRLGWWLGNPGSSGEKRYRLDGPSWAIAPLLNEMFGRTTDDRPYVYLSDGGHFENLGLYEMVRRRCRFILAVDSGCDKNFEFEDLGNAVRKVALDLGVRITFQGLTAIRFRAATDPPPAEDPPFYAVGTVHYREADGDGEDGIVLYLKPSFHGSRITNVGIRNYAAANPDFPHQSTGDQWFSEAQFESYRALGFEMADGVFAECLADAPGGERTFERVFAGARAGAQRRKIP